ncbi:MAG: hypothetical protein JW881_15905 [Spirochaetales bacterium]|nr:hypothetical protein [Spirochaetales bacterium]
MKRIVLQNIVRLLWCVAAVFLASCAMNRDLVIRIGPMERLYSDSELPFYFDSSMATVRQDKSRMFFFHTSGLKTYKFSGTPDAPLSNLVWVKNNTDFMDRNGLLGEFPGVNFWIQNIFIIPGRGWLSFSHIEKFTGSGGYDGTEQYSIGILYSDDEGETWTFCGEIIKPFIHTSDAGNAGGVPVLVVGKYFYVYYNEHTGSNGVAVARAPVSDVIKAAVKHKVVPWVKYNNGSWSENALTGTGSFVMPYADSHTDAAASKYRGVYFYLAPMNGSLRLFSSKDGIEWWEKAIIDQAWNTWFVFGMFASLESDASADCMTVGNNFSIIWPRKNSTDFFIDTLYRRKVTVTME